MELNPCSVLLKPLDRVFVLVNETSNSATRTLCFQLLSVWLVSEYNEKFFMTECTNQRGGTRTSTINESSM